MIASLIKLAKIEEKKRETRCEDRVSVVSRRYACRGDDVREKEKFRVSLSLNGFPGFSYGKYSKSTHGR
jgi:hypothetical protein